MKRDRNQGKITWGGAKGKITAPEWVWDLVGWLLIVAVIVTLIKIWLGR